jgi:hypothetical protein
VSFFGVLLLSDSSGEGLLSLGASFTFGGLLSAAGALFGPEVALEIVGADCFGGAIFSRAGLGLSSIGVRNISCGVIPHDIIVLYNKTWISVTCTSRTHPLNDEALDRCNIFTLRNPELTKC